MYLPKQPHLEERYWLLTLSPLGDLYPFESSPHKQAGDVQVIKVVLFVNVYIQESEYINGFRIGITKPTENALIEDVDGNKIKVPMFEYNRGKNLFFSKGEIEINDAIGNTYKFSEIFIDEKKRKLLVQI